ncbi:MAG: MYG1 family protein [Fibrobacteres bacterium]|nr:MYG1 family protein [Fibrobacterota bacterium]
MKYNILTHDGKAHMDELLAIALIAIHNGEEPANIERRQSQAVSDAVAAGNIPENTWLVDVGLVYDPERNLYDHHQDGSLDCSALQIFSRFFPHLKGTELDEYIQLVSKVDNQGIKSLNDWRLIDESKSYWSFTHSLLLRLFERDPWPSLRLVIEGLKDRIDFEQKIAEGVKWLSDPHNIEIINVAGINVIKYLKQPPEDLISATRSADASIIEKHDIIATYSFDDRDPKSRILFRTNRGAERVDFNKAAPAKSLFCHKGGFLLRFVPDSDREWLKLIESSIVT